jgi:AmiR/NasT family two-component response regulator
MNPFDEYLGPLEYAMSNQTAVAQATGVIMQRHNLSAGEASKHLCAHAASLGLQPAQFARMLLDWQLPRRRAE